MSEEMQLNYVKLVEKLRAENAELEAKLWTAREALKKVDKEIALDRWSHRAQSQYLERAREITQLALAKIGKEGG